MNGPRVSFVIPAFNVRKFVLESVASALNQSFRDIEVLLIDDGSSDGTIDELRGIDDRRLRILRNDRNRGIVYSRNRGIQEAAGEFIAFLDADDIALPDRIGAQVEFLEQNPQVGLVGGGAVLIDGQGREFSRILPPHGESRIIEEIFTRNCFICSTVTIRTKVARSLGGFRQEAHYVEDYDLWMRAALRYRLENLSMPFAKYRIHRGQVSISRFKPARIRADASRIAAYNDGVERGVIGTEVRCPVLSRRQCLCGLDPSVGADLRRWSRTYRAIGDKIGARRISLSALLYSPLSLGLYVEIVSPSAYMAMSGTRVWNLARWYWLRLVGGIK